ncbi:uroporphyrinogen-III synthase [Myceligenerans pegani]|uniref:Uroporphyrinogen-III synthase n=1 Tax=Myceligenerans pegani TaxID=2776917 RepID=A0ABR9N2X3_9MICO|nr:uroporphyrinogen-III synthase [Myceligenerans sp. TRM 65318]MBE1877994.1 uroporphyrinogen-III synthase [Myceligenerans sp. TRM 65318]MBE3020265.1 uroporphyrinogen-III synthase [Myceligenerans sp. TRM 65318]
MTSTVPVDRPDDDRRGTTRPRVLVARSHGRAAPLLDLLREAGVDAVAAPVIERAPVDDPAGLDEARAALARGEYAWVAVTSVNAVDALLGPSTDHDGSRSEAPSRDASPPFDGSAANAPDPSGAGETRWACVGPATRGAIEARGHAVALVPAGAMTAAGLATAFPHAPAANAAPTPPAPEHDQAMPSHDRAPGTQNGVVGEGRGGGPDDPPGSRQPGSRVLVPLGDLAAPTLAEGLRAKGWDPHVVTAYRTVARDLPRDVVGHARTAGYDAVVVASGSAARQLAAQLGPQRVVAIGEPSARAAREAGHDVVAVAAAPTDDALATAVVHALDLP